MADYEVHNVGVLEARASDARRAKLEGLPPVTEDESDSCFVLPTVEVLTGKSPVMYRLPLMFGSIAKRMYEDARRFYAAGRSFLPAHYRFRWLDDGAACVQPIDV